jgi:methylenetetrahydrofolate dehydrogenase (NADP+)/methenyltetrahydrofolate cyclohydrolase
MTVLLKAAPIVEKHTKILKQKTTSLSLKNVVPCLKIVLVGNDPASKIYTRNKKRLSEKINASCEIIVLNEDISESDFVNKLRKLVENVKVHGILVQLPLPKHLKNVDIHKIIPPEKDVDGFHSQNLGRLMEGHFEDSFVPCTPKGIMTLLDFYGYNVMGEHVVIIGRSLIVGKPLAALMTHHHATVTLCHSRTQNLEYLTKEADIIVTAIGRPKFLTRKHLSLTKIPIIIDVGINSLPNKKLCGDVDFEDIIDWGMATAITPVPGGVGPLTILSLAENLLIAAERSIYEMES